MVKSTGAPSEAIVSRLLLALAQYADITPRGLKLGRIMEQLNKYWTVARDEFPVLLNLSLNILAAFTILIIGWTVAKWVRRRIRKSTFGSQHKIDSTLRPVIASTVFYVLMAMTIYAFLVKLGVPDASLIAVFGGAALGVGLALKDTLSNIASGIMLIALRPVSVGEFIDTPNAVGTVEEIGLFATTVKSVEGLYLYVPNRLVWTSRIQNFARHQNRKAIIEIGIGYESDLEKVRAGLMQLLSETPDVMTLPTPPEVYVMNFGDSAITLSCRCWLPGDNWLLRTSNLRMEIKSHLNKTGVDIPFPQRVMHTAKS